MKFKRRIVKRCVFYMEKRRKKTSAETEVFR